MICKKCQGDNPEDAKFCGECGSDLVEQYLNESPNPNVLPDPTIQRTDDEIAMAQVEVGQTVQPPKDVAKDVVQGETGDEEGILSQPTAPIVAQPTAPIAPKAPKKKSKLPVLLISVILIVAIASAGYVFGKDAVMSMFKTPEERLVDGFFNSMEARSGEVYLSMELDDLDIDTGDSQSDEMIEDILKDLKIESMVRFDEKQRQIEGDLNLRLMGTSLFKADYYVTDDYVIVDIPLVYDQPLYIDVHKLYKTMQDNNVMSDIEDLSYMMGDYGGIVGEASREMDNVEGVDFDKLDESFDHYKDLSNRDTYESYENLDWTPYKEVMIPYFETFVIDVQSDEFEMEFDSDVTYKGERYNLDYDIDGSTDLMMELVEVLAMDDHMRAFIEEVSVKYLQRIIEREDYVMYALITSQSSDEVTSWKSEYSDEIKLMEEEVLSEIDNAFDEMEIGATDIEDELMSTMDTDVEDMIDSMEVTYSMSVDDDGYIRSQIFEIEGSLGEGGEIDPFAPSADFLKFLKVRMVSESNLLDQTIVFEGIDKKDALDIGSMSDEEMMDFEADVEANLMGVFMSNPALSELLGEGMMY